MVENLQIEEELIGRFLGYLVENEKLQTLIDRKDFGALHFLIGDHLENCFQILLKKEN